MPGFAEVISEWWFQCSHRPHLKWKLSVSSRFHIIFPSKCRFPQFHVLIKQSTFPSFASVRHLSSRSRLCLWGFCRKWKVADCPKLLLKWLTNHHELQRLLENHQSIVTHPWFSLPWCFGYRLRWRVWACLCICYSGSAESAGRKGRNSEQK